MVERFGLVDRAAALREFKRAKAQAEAPADYLDLCIRALERGRREH